MAHILSASAAFPEAATAPPKDKGDAGPTRICFPFGGGIVGGSHISAVKLIQGLDRTRYSPIILLHHEEGQLGEFLRAEGLDFTPLSGIGFFGNGYGVQRKRGARATLGAVRDQWRLARLLRQNRVRIVHTNDGSMHVSWALPAKLAGARLLWHHRGAADARGVRFFAPLAADCIVGVSDFALSRVRRIPHIARKTAVVYSPFDARAEPVDRRQAHDALTTELGLDPATRLIGFFGHFQERKRPLLFIDMVHQIGLMRPDLPVTGLMFGSPLVAGMEEQMKEKARSLGIADRLRLMGFRYPSAPLMAGCDIHAVPAVQEPFGRSLIEAMLLGTPVVAAASGGNIEAIDHGVNGLLTEADNPAAMAAAVIELIDSPGRLARISETALLSASQRFGAERHVDQISAIYQALLSPERMRAARSW
ncbi:glycosyltransferase family 4 protein [Sphingobium mellinum]|uniref:glycosyltransferase family 4 protein n=1 Tax=Sphingobium mellinum TaxID=1387166 RepID=UPI0030EB358A